MKLNLKVVERLESSGSLPIWVLIATLAGMFATTFPITILAVSLSHMANEFQVSTSVMTWVITAPMVLSAIALPIMGKLGDLYGHRRIFLLGFLISTITSLISAAAWDVTSLIGLRTLTSIVGAATQPTAMALIFSVYTGDKRVKAMGWWGMVTAAAPATGLILGGPLVDYFGWQMVFILQSAFSLIAVSFAFFVLKETSVSSAKFDIPGAGLLAIAVAAIMVIITQSHTGMFPSQTLGLIAVGGAVSLGLFLWVENKVAAPLLPLQLFMQRDFSVPIVASSLMSASYMGAFILAPVILMQVFNFSLTQTSFIMLLRTLSLTVSSPYGSKLTIATNAKFAAIFGTGMMTLSLLLIGIGIYSNQFIFMATGLMMQGAGFGLGLPGLNSTVANSVEDANQGVASATNRLISTIGTALGIAILTAYYDANASHQGLIIAMIIGAGLALASGACAAIMSSRQIMASAYAARTVEKDAA